MESEPEAKLWCDQVNPANKAALEAWLRETGIRLVQVNGQRKYGGPPPGWVGGPPAPGSEVFIGRLPQDVYEHQLIPLFGRVGRLYEFRLMMTFSGLNRGFAYARYSSRRGAQAAIAALHNHPLRPACPLLVCRSTEKCELCLDGLPSALPRRALLRALHPLAGALTGAALLPSPLRPPDNIALLRFSSHRAAAMAKKLLVEGHLWLGGEQVTVDWLKPELKQQLRLQGAGEPSSPPPSPAPWAGPEDGGPPACALAALHGLCQRQQLGAPVFLTKCLGSSLTGWYYFWYQVVIPGHAVPFSGLMWVAVDHGGQNEHEAAKEAVALRLLDVLGGPKAWMAPETSPPGSAGDLVWARAAAR
ncbi:dead end protein homolog 1 [Tachyglossus aculeatus]|uniref:dead end protein homolog 1 n=1 Tax=Tachyglossus aculeatus TaxID=9261 RepID=UPI0018F736D5|nr:dead end protein homolog 1 [Tachyglossus aculeatus]